jgi:hypothetical protein
MPSVLSAGTGGAFVCLCLGVRVVHALKPTALEVFRKD